MNFFKKNWFGIVTAGGTLAVFSVAIIKSGGFRQFSRILSKFDVLELIIAFAAMVLYWVLDALIIHMLVKTDNTKAKFTDSVGTAMTGILYNSLTPFASGGQPMQIYYMRKRGISVGDACSVITIKSLIYQICMVVAAIFGVFYAGGFFMKSVPNFALYAAAGFVCNFIFIGVLLVMSVREKFTKTSASFAIKILSKLKFIKDEEDYTKRAFGQIDIFQKATAEVRKKPKLVIFCFIPAFLQIFLFYSIPYLIMSSLKIEQTVGLFVDFWRMVSANAIIMVTTAFIPMPGASGAAEGSFFLFFREFFPYGAAMAAMFIWRVITYYFGIFAGAGVCLYTLWAKSRKKIGKLNIIKI